jgi:hypothetical protein
MPIALDAESKVALRTYLRERIAELELNDIKAHVDRLVEDGNLEALRALLSEVD